MRLGRVGLATPAPTSVFAVNSFCMTWSVTFTSRKPNRSGQREIAGRLAALDEDVDVARAARVEEDVALPDARLLREQAGLEERLAARLGELAVVAGEAARQMLEVGVVAAPLPHAVEALEDPPGDAPRRVGVVVRAGDAGRGRRRVEEREHHVLVLGERRGVGGTAAEAGHRGGDDERMRAADRWAQVVGVLEDERRQGDGAGAQAVDAGDLALACERDELVVGRI